MHETWEPNIDSPQESRVIFFASLETHTPLHTPSRAASTLCDIVWLRSNFESSLWNRSRHACISNDSLLMCVECSREINRKKKNFKPLLLHGLMGLQRSHHSYFYSSKFSRVHSINMWCVCEIVARVARETQWRGEKTQQQAAMGRKRKFNWVFLSFWFHQRWLQALTSCCGIGSLWPYRHRVTSRRARLQTVITHIHDILPILLCFVWMGLSAKMLLRRSTRRSFHWNSNSSMCDLTLKPPVDSRWGNRRAVSTEEFNINLQKHAKNLYFPVSSSHSSAPTAAAKILTN